MQCRADTSFSPTSYSSPDMTPVAEGVCGRCGQAGSEDEGESRSRTKPGADLRRGDFPDL